MHSESHQTPPLLSESQRLAAIVRQSRDAILRLGVDGKVSEANPAACGFFDSSAHSPVGRHFPDLFEAGDQRAAINHALDRVRDSADDNVVQTRIHLNRPPQTVEISLSLLCDDNGTPDGIAAVVRNISHREEEQEQLRLVIEQAPNALIMSDDQGKIIMTNAQADALFGYERGELSGRSVEVLVPNAIRPAHPSLRREFFKAPKVRAMGAGRDLSGRRKDGTEVPVEIGLNPITTGQGQFVVASVVDITERKRAQEKLEAINTQLHQKNQEMEQFIYTVSHDLKSPLVTISGFAKRLSMALQGALTAKQNHQLSRILANVEHMEGLLNDLLSLSRVIRQDIDKRLVDTEDVVRQAMSTLEGAITDADAKVVMDSPVDAIYANERLLFQCVQNLLANAVQYREPSRPLVINVSTARDGDYVSLCVEDNGIGIEKKYHQQIFRIFERLDVGEGTGVGLAVVKTIVERHGGNISLQSQPNGGSSFTLHFPCRRSHIRNRDHGRH